MISTVAAATSLNAKRTVSQIESDLNTISAQAASLNATANAIPATTGPTATQALAIHSSISGLAASFNSAVETIKARRASPNIFSHINFMGTNTGNWRDHQFRSRRAGRCKSAPYSKVCITPKEQTSLYPPLLHGFLQHPMLFELPNPSEIPPPAAPRRRLDFSHPEAVPGCIPLPSPTYIFHTHSRIVIQTREAIYGVHVPSVGVEQASVCKLFNLRGQPHYFIELFGLGVAFANGKYRAPTKLVYVWHGDELEWDANSNANVSASANVGEIDEGRAQRRKWAEPAWASTEVTSERILAYDEWSGRMVLALSSHRIVVVNLASYKGSEFI